MQEKGRNHNSLDLWRGIWVVAELDKAGDPAHVTLELLSKAREMAEKIEVQVTSVLMGYNVSGLAQRLIAYGADRVLVVDHPELASFTDEVYGKVLSELALKERPEIILAGATDQSRSFIPMVATRLETGLTANCMELDIRPEDRLLLPTRPAYGGNLMATITCPDHRPQMATVKPHVIKIGEPDFQRDGEIVAVTPSKEALEHRVKVVESKPLEMEGPDLRQAEVIVAAGRGIQKKENLALVKELAELLGGAVGATRPVTDEGWLPEYTQIGQTGVTVSPKLYIGCGISGAAPHTVGIQGSEIIVAINKDPDAPIFDMATYGLVGDLNEILPLLIKRIKEVKNLEKT